MIDEKTKSVRRELRLRQAQSVLFQRPGFLIRRLHQIHIGLFFEETSAFNITPVQYGLLSTLSENGELDQNTLAREIGLERSSVAEVIPRLQARGLVDRNPAAYDGRVKLVKLTRQGKALVKRMENAVQRANQRTLDQVASSDRDEFVLQLIRLVEGNNGAGVPPLQLLERPRK
jgi:DNA-binding MarR family transcriptional regulator